MRAKRIKNISILIVSILFLFINQSTLYAVPLISAEQAVLIDQKSGAVLYEKNMDNPQLIASITKVMTAILAIEYGVLTDQVVVSADAVLTEGSSIYLQENERISLEELIYGLMLRSGNDAAVSIAEHIGGSVEGFVYLMNEKVRWLGLDNTSFANPHGLDAENHFSTAQDIAELMRYAMEDPVFRKINETRTYIPESRSDVWTNKNKLLTNYYPHTIGGKTGYTKAAGRTLVTVAKKEDIELIAVTINDPNDWFDHIRLYEWGFEQSKQLELVTFKEIEESDDQAESMIETVVYFLRKMVGLI